ncbi:AAA family ATPase [Rhabdothermincola salaria]|uniref:AAA family ATPase n=1 Tax=Rhabdothermincola salaria TaxID=2903142 RepID=UPI001E5DD4AE|nr:AAA family ATPase [Rhabdothermincola salaria]
MSDTAQRSGPAAGGSACSSTGFVGRESLTRSLEMAWDRTRRGEGTTLALLGGAAIGKSTLLSHLARHVGGDDRAPVVWVVGRGGDLCRPLAAVEDLCRQLLGDPAEPGEAESFSVDEVEPVAAGHCLRDALERASRRRPLALLVDDVHDLDPASRTALSLALRGVQAPRLLAVVAGRPVEPVLRFTEGFPAMEVSALATPQARRLLRESAGRSIAPDVERRLLAVAQGNPLALRTLPNLLEPAHLDGTRLLPEPVPIAGDLRVAFERPLASLTRPARDLVELAAVSADGGWTAIEAATDGRAGEALGEVEAGGLGRLVDGKLVFTHPLVRSAAIAAMSDHRRRSLNRRLADVASLPDSTRLLHRAHAVAGPDEDLVDALVDAAKGWRERGGVEAAARLLERAVVLTGDDARRRVLRVEASEVLALSGAASAAREHLEAVVAVPGPGSVGAEVQLARLEALQGDPFGAWQRLRECATLATGAELGSVLTSMAVPLGMLGLVGEVEAQASLAMDVLDAGSVAHQVATVIHAHAVVSLDEGRGAPLVAGLPELDALAAVDHDPQLGLHLGRAQGLAERCPAGVDMLTALIARGRGEGARASLAMTYGTLGDVLVRSCRYDEAVTALDESLALSVATGQRAFAPFWYALRARVRAIRGDATGARGDLDAGFGLADEFSVPGARYFLLGAAGLAALARQDHLSARENLEECRFFEEAAGPLSPNLGRWVPDLVETHIALGRDDLARSAAVGLLEATAAPGTARWTRAAAARCRGLLAQGDDPRAAVEAFEEAVRTFDATVDAFDRARALLDLARARSRSGVADSDAAAMEARYAFRRLGADAWEAQVDDGVGRAEDPGLASLTPAELRILVEVSHGATNHQIARRLHLSPKTVANQLSRVYRKLGVSSRTEAAHRYLSR